jgi:hypothetical protein
MSTSAARCRFVNRDKLAESEPNAAKPEDLETIMLKDLVIYAECEEIEMLQNEYRRMDEFSGARSGPRLQNTTHNCQGCR